MSTELSSLDATGQADLVRRGDVSPRELVDAAIARIEALNPTLNAVITERFDAARGEAGVGAHDGPFRGVPMLIKDLACTMAGEPSLDGMRAAKDANFVAKEDSHLVRRYREAGFVLLGRTNTPELGLTATTEPVSFGPTHNPWDTDRTPGGSSGGSAAAVAAGLVPVAHASDGGGSIRIPASCCGLVGLKTSRGRVSIGPALGELNRFLSVQFAVTRTVRDAAALLDVAAGEEPGDPVVAPPPRRPFADEMGAPVPPLRVGVLTNRPGTDEPAHPDCVAAAESAARLLEGLGHHVETSAPDFGDPARFETFLSIWCLNAAFALDRWGTLLGRDLTADDVEPYTWLLAERGRRVSGVEFMNALNEMQRVSRDIAQWWEDFDLLVTPTLLEPPPALGILADTEDPMKGYARTGLFASFTPFANQTGQPAISLPLHWNPDNIPVGVQFVAKYGREDLLLRVASQLEDAQPWSGRKPPVHA
ncbi:MAG: amidase [Actinomycetota bacterium]|nr:amidase [Actinomycetota bacterium]